MGRGRRRIAEHGAEPSLSELAASLVDADALKVLRRALTLAREREKIFRLEQKLIATVHDSARQRLSLIHISEPTRPY